MIEFIIYVQAFNHTYTNKINKNPGPIRGCDLSLKIANKITVNLKKN